MWNISSSMIKNETTCTYEIKSRIATAKPVFDKFDIIQTVHFVMNLLATTNAQW
jgi:hypothetical protein